MPFAEQAESVSPCHQNSYLKKLAIRLESLQWIGDSAGRQESGAVRRRLIVSRAL